MRFHNTSSTSSSPTTARVGDDVIVMYIEFAEIPGVLRASGGEGAMYRSRAGPSVGPLSL